MQRQRANRRGWRWTTSSLLGVSLLMLLVACGGDGEGRVTSAEPTTTELEVTTSRPTTTLEPTTTTAPKLGTRENPFPLGAPLRSDNGWEVTITGVNLDATQVVAAENPFNQPAPPGMKYVLVNAAVVNSTPDPGNPGFEIQFAMLGSQNRKWDGSNAFCTAVVPQPMYNVGELFPGGRASGNTCFVVPESEVADGSLLVLVSSAFGEPVFVRTT
jgi:hypothetical protein